jgi:hypothetical protein
MAAPCDLEAKLYMPDAAMRNLSERAQFDEADGRGVRMMKAFTEESCRNPVAGAGVQLETGVCHDHTI